MDSDREISPTPPPQRVLLKHAEVMASALASSSRARGGGLWFTLALLLLLCLAVWIGHLAAFMLAQELPLPALFLVGPWLPVLLPAALGLIAVKLALDLEQGRAGRAYLARLAAIGAPLEREATYEVTPEALVLTTERMVLAPRWPAIDTVERGEHGWVLSADQLHFLIPFAAFPSSEAQRPLLAAITSRMTAEARGRSREAVEFAELAPAANPAETHQTAPPMAEKAPEALPSEPVLEARGWLTQEQARWAASVIYGRVAHAGFHQWAYPLAGGVTGFLAAVVLVGAAGFLIPSGLLMRYPAAVFFGGAVLLLSGAAFGLRRSYNRLGIVLGKAWDAGLDRRGVPLQIEARWGVTETGITYHTERFSGEASFASIHELLHQHGYWIIAADALTLCIPDAAFVSPAEAHTFMSRLKSRMTEPARARSVGVASEAASAS